MGRWISRDPAGEAGGENVYVFASDDCITHTDFLGLWGTFVHKDLTSAWATMLDYRNPAAEDVGDYDERTDGNLFGFTLLWWLQIGGTGPLPWQDQRYHFNRSPAPALNDTRLDLADRHFAKALSLCAWLDGAGKDQAHHAVAALGVSLHPLQDWVAHGEYGLRNPGVIGVTHNSGGGLVAGDGGPAKKYPDRIDLDVVGGDAYGRAVVSAFTYSAPVGAATETARYTYGNKRLNKTGQLTVNRLLIFLQSVRRNAKPCGECRAFILLDSDPRRYN